MINRPKADSHQAGARALIFNQRTMVLATSAAGAPWAAPVYYVYSASGFYFLSSPRARHIEHIMANKAASAAIFADSERWEEIRGLQMSGTIDVVHKKPEQLKALARFVLKFPFARPFLETGPSRSEEQPRVGDRVQLFVFVPQVVYYLDNRLGFGERWPVDIKR
jgi:uncharacterized protein